MKINSITITEALGLLFTLKNKHEELERKIAQLIPSPTIQDDWIQKKEAKQLLGYSSDTSLQYLRDHQLIVFTYVSPRKILYSKASILNYLKSKKGIDYGQVG